MRRLLVAHHRLDVGVGVERAELLREVLAEARKALTLRVGVVGERAAALLVAAVIGTGWRFALLAGWIWGVCWAFPAFRFLREIDPAVPFLMAPVLGVWTAVFAAGTAALFTLLEWSRSRMLPWNELGTTMWSRTDVIQLAAVTGSYGVSFLVAFTGAGIGCAFLTRFRGAGLRVLAAATGCFALISLGGAISLLRVPEPQPPNWRPALLQGDLSQRRNAVGPLAEEALDIYLDLTGRAIRLDPPPDIILWPESAVPVPFRAAHPTAARFRRAVAAAARGSGIPLLIGAIDFIGDGRGMTNSAIHIDSAGRMVHKYDKIHRVPFGEYIPFRSYLPEFLVRRIDMNRDLTPGDNYDPVELKPGIRAGIAICFEGVFSYLTREFARRGANVLVVLSNDAWYPTSSEPEQHLANAVMRCVETRLPMVRCGNNGGSLLVTPQGSITQVLTVPGPEPRPELRRGRGFGTVELHVPADPGETFFVRFGEWFVLLLWILLAAWLLTAAEHRRRIADHPVRFVDEFDDDVVEIVQLLEDQAHITLLLRRQGVEELPALDRRIVKRGIPIVVLVVKDAEQCELDDDARRVGSRKNIAQSCDIFGMQPFPLRPGEERYKLPGPRRKRIRVEIEIARPLEVAAAEQPGLIEAVLFELTEIALEIECAVDQGAVMLGGTDQQPKFAVDRKIMRIDARNADHRFRHGSPPGSG